MEEVLLEVADLAEVDQAEADQAEVDITTTAILMVYMITEEKDMVEEETMPLEAEVEEVATRSLVKKSIRARSSLSVISITEAKKMRSLISSAPKDTLLMSELPEIQQDQ